MAKMTKQQQMEYFEKALERQEAKEAKLRKEGKLIGRLEPVKGGKGNFVLTEATDDEGETYTKWELTPGSGYDVKLNERIDTILDIFNQITEEDGGELDERNIFLALWTTHPEICLALEGDEDGRELFNKNITELSNQIKQIHGDAPGNALPKDAYHKVLETFGALKNYHTPQRAKRLIMSNSAISNCLRSGWDFTEEPRIPVGKNSKNETIYAQASFSDESFSKQLESSLDLDIMDGIGTLIVEAAEKKGLTKLELLLSEDFVKSLRFTYRQIYESYTKRRPKNDSTINELKERMLRLSKIWGHIEANTQTQTQKDLTEIRGFDHKEPFIMFAETAGRIGGKTTTMVQPQQIPLLFRYAYTFNQVISIPEDALKVPFKRINNERTIITNYLARRVALMKRRKNKIVSDRILLKRVWELPGLSISNTQRLRYIDDIKTILSYWVDIGFIENGKIERDAPKNAGAKQTPWRHITIDLNPDIPFFMATEE